MSILDNKMIAKMVGYRNLNESMTEAPEQPEQDVVAPAAQPKSIIFKCPGHNGDDAKFQAAVKRMVDKKSLEFAGVAISSIFVKPSGNFNLYGKTYFYGKDGSIYYFEGRDTENWKGFKVLIARSNLTVDAATPEQLAQIKKIDENVTLAPPKADGEDEIGSFSFKGRADMPDRLTNNMGDNPMAEDMYQPTSEITGEMLQILYDKLVSYGVSDEDIALGYDKLSPKGYVKLARSMTGQTMDEPDAADLVKKALNTLSQDLVEDTYNTNLQEFTDMPIDSQFTYVIDALGNVTVRDGDAGTEIHLKGQDALELIGELQMHGGTAEKEQYILSQYKHVMEDDDTVEMTADESDGGELEEDVNMKDHFGIPEDAHALLAGLKHDIDSMKAKLTVMRATAIKNSDVMGKFAAELFQGEVQTLEHSLQDYLSKSE